MKLLFTTHKNIDYVFDHLTNMEKFVTVHPVIFKIDNIGSDKYLIHERLKFGFISFSFTYPVTIEKDNANKTITISATVFKVTKIEMKYTLEIKNEYTIINEDICFKSAIPIKFLLKYIFKKQHQQLFNNIELK